LEVAVQKRQRRIDQMRAISEALNVAEMYYELQQKEVAVVVNAYSTYGLRVAKTLSNVNRRIGLPSPEKPGTSVATSVASIPTPSTTKPSTSSPRYPSEQCEITPDHSAYDDYAESNHNNDGDDDSDFDSSVMPESVSPPRASGYQPSPIAPFKPTRDVDYRLLLNPARKELHSDRVSGTGTTARQTLIVSYFRLSPLPLWRLTVMLHFNPRGNYGHPIIVAPIVAL
uniref:DUF630 domain-containing protein n=1 Tax=Echinostoma caproni TaxID=27848 RepID=A0A183B1Y8_9TREM